MTPSPADSPADLPVNDRELVTTRVLPVVPALAFELWTSPAHVSHWWGPDGFATTTHAHALRPGGLWRFTMHGPDGRDYANLVEFVEVARPSRLVYRHRDDGETEPVSFHVTVTFAPLGETKTLLTLRMVFTSAEDLARVEDAYGASQGQLDTLARLAAYVASADTARAAPRSDREIATSRVVPATPAETFDALRDPAKLARWWGPHGFTSTFHAFDFRPGGAWDLTLHGPDGKDYANALVFRAVEPPTRVVIEHVSKPEYVAELTLDAAPDGTRVTFRQTFATAEQRARIAAFAGPANEENLDRLVEVLLATRVAAPPAPPAP